MVLHSGFGAGADGDADRNIILGKNCFVSPGDSLAIILQHAQCIPFFRDGVKGCARSLPTTGALDRVAKKKNIPCFVTPTGWKNFGNLMESGTKLPGKTYTPFICGHSGALIRVVLEDCFRKFLLCSSLCDMLPR